MDNENEETGLVLKQQPSAMVAIEQSRAVQEVQAALVIAKKFPRDTNAAYTKIIESCKRYSLAERATYSYPRGKDERGGKNIVSGPSIRLAEVLAQNWGNLDFGVREIERRQGVSIAESYCWDMENNTRQTKTFEVPHEIGLKGGRKKILTDPRDLYELVANQGARRLRACILGIIPGDIVDAALGQVKKTLAKGDGEPIADRVRRCTLAFKELGVSQEMIEERLGHKMDLTTPEELVELQSIHNSIKDKQAKRGDFFSFPEEDEENTKAATLKEKLGAK